MKKKLSYNILFSLLLQIVAVINSFITSKITINYFGSEINGLVSSINQFLNYISLLEGGVGAVIMAQLYKPIYENDKNKISDIISSSKKFFRQIICIPYFHLPSQQSSHPHHKHKNHAQISPIHILSIHPQFAALSPV